MHGGHVSSLHLAVDVANPTCVWVQNRRAQSSSDWIGGRGPEAGSLVVKSGRHCCVVGGTGNFPPVYVCGLYITLDHVG